VNLTDTEVREELGLMVRRNLLAAPCMTNLDKPVP